MLGIAYGMGAMVWQVVESFAGDASPTASTPVPAGTEYLGVNELSRQMALPGGLTSADLVTHLQARIRRLDPQLSAIIELNPNFRFLHESVTVGFDPKFRWDGTKYYGASLGALVNIGRDKGYKLVYANATNAFFVREDLIENPGDFHEDSLKQFLDQHNYDHFSRPWVSV